MSRKPIPLARITLSLLALAASSQLAHSQAGDAKDRPGQDQEAIWRDIDVPPAPVLSPEQALASFSLEPGYSLELVASEPLVNDPVAIAWDEFGRLWVTEMWAYMPDVDGTGEHEPVSRVVVLEDLDQDGQMDRSTVFLDKLVLPRAVSIVKGGVLIADPPNLYFCEDTDGDLVSDQQTIIASYAAIGNVEHSENGLMHGIDNWLYNAKSERRLKFADGKIIEEPTLFRGQWGITQDDFGRLYYNHNSFYLYGDMVPWENVTAHPGWTPQAGIATEVVKDRSVFTNRVNPGINRAYRENWLRTDHRMKNVDAASAPVIYRGDRYPADAQGNAFVPEPAGNVVSRFQLHDQNREVIGEKRLHESPKWGPIEFIASTDERFRPVTLSNGPDGFLYVVDMYRGILQHKDYLTTFLRTQIIERGLHNPVGLGRIYRVVHESDSPSRSVTKLGDLSPPQLVTFLASENGWQRDTAQRLLVQSATKDPIAIDALNRLATDGSELARIHALWTLQGLAQLDPDIAAAAYRSGTPWVKVHALRAASPFLAQTPQPKDPLWTAFLDALNSETPRVRLQAFQLLPEANSPKLTLENIASLSPSDLQDPYFIDAAVSALYRHETAFLAAATVATDHAKFSTLLKSLAFAIVQARTTETVLAFAETQLATDTPQSISQSIIAGFDQALSQEDATPLALDSQPSFLANIPVAKTQLFTWPGKVDPNAKKSFHYSDLELASINRGQPIYQNACAICHQNNGAGQASLAPPLAGSNWVTGSKRRLALVVGQGLSGPITVKGQTWNATMPPHANHPALTDEAITDLLNYIRATWGNNAAPFQAGEARAYLEEHSTRTQPWTAAELEALSTQ